MIDISCLDTYLVLVQNSHPPHLQQILIHLLLFILPLPLTRETKPSSKVPIKAHPHPYNPYHSNPTNSLNPMTHNSIQGLLIKETNPPSKNIVMEYSHAMHPPPYPIPPSTQVEENIQPSSPITPYTQIQTCQELGPNHSHMYRSLNKDHAHDHKTLDQTPPSTTSKKNDVHANPMFDHDIYDNPIFDHDFIFVEEIQDDPFPSTPSHDPPLNQYQSTPPTASNDTLHSHDQDIPSILCRDPLPP